MPNNKPNNKTLVSSINKSLTSGKLSDFLSNLNKLVLNESESESKFSAEIGMSRQGVKKALKRTANPSLATIMQILGGVGLKLTTTKK